MDPFNLQRFLDAQENSYALALQEIRAGRKLSHWMWYIFPQLAGLGHSHNAVYYAISGVEEAQAYLGHPVLGLRLIEISQALLEHAEQPIERILGTVDAMKCKSCMKLFASLESTNSIFDRVLQQFF